jgi:hypothetical protein
MKKERQSFRMRVDERFFADLNELRRREDDVPDNTEMVRRLIMRALAKMPLVQGHPMPAAPFVQGHPMPAVIRPSAETKKPRAITKK